jgi:hypothetical protein
MLRFTASLVNIFRCTRGYRQHRPTFRCNIDGILQRVVQGIKRGSCSHYGEVGIDATELWFLTARAGAHVQTFCRYCNYRQDKNKKFWKELIACFPWYDTGRIGNDVSNNSSIVACVFVTEATFIPSRCLATIVGYTYRRTDWLEGLFI